MDVKKILSAAYLEEWKLQCAANKILPGSRRYRVGLLLYKIERFFTIDRIQAYVDDKIRTASDKQAEEEYHIDNLKRLARIYARTLCHQVIKKDMISRLNRRSIKNEKGRKRSGARQRNDELSKAYEAAIIEQRKKYASNTYPCYKPKQKTPATVFVPVQ